MRILGVDFTSAPRRAKPITIARCELHADVLTLLRVDGAEDWQGFEAILQEPGPWVGGFDFPFGLPRQLVQELGLPQRWPALVEACAALDRARWRALLDGYRAGRPVGQKYLHRATDRPARSSSPMKLVNPPVALMFHEGARRLLEANVTVPGLHVGDPARIALEAYPALLARSVVSGSYKNDAPAKQTSERRQRRAEIVAALRSPAPPLGIRLDAGRRASTRRLVDDGTGDTLDAVLCAAQAAWGWQRRDRDFGLPPGIDELEGWIVTAPWGEPARMR